MPLHRPDPHTAWRPLALLGLAVLALHGLLMLPWAAAPVPAPGRVAPARPTSVVLLPARPPAAAVPVTGTAGLADSGGAPVPPQARTAPGRIAPQALPGPAPGEPPPGPMDAADRARPGAAQTLAGAPDATEPEPEAEPAAPDSAAGETPPLYDALWPAPASLRYALHYRGRSGEAVLGWQPAGDRYALQLQGLADAAGSAADLAGPAGRRNRARALIEQASQGRLAPHGLVPDRFTDRRGGRSLRAANFRHELGRIEFSGPATVHPDWLGAQDRLSWWVQLPAILAASAVPPDEIRLFVVDAWGGGELWRFKRLASVALDGPFGSATVQHWRREPRQPEGQRVEVWLDPARGFWPVQLRFTGLRSGDRIELQLRSMDRPAS